MPRKKHNTDSASDQPRRDRHKPSFMVRVSKVFEEGVDEMAERLGGDRTDVVKTAVREFLEKHGLWPRKS